MTAVTLLQISTRLGTISSKIGTGLERGISLAGALYDTINAFREIAENLNPTVIPEKELNSSAASDIFLKNAFSLEKLEKVDLAEATLITEELRRFSERTPIKLGQLIQSAKEGIKIKIPEDAIGGVVKTAADAALVFGKTTEEDTNKLTEIFGRLEFEKQLSKQQIQKSLNGISIASDATGIEGDKILETFSKIENPQKYGKDIESLAALTAVFIDKGEKSSKSAEQVTQLMDGLESLGKEGSKLKLEELGFDNKEIDAFRKKSKNDKKGALALLVGKLEGKTEEEQNKIVQSLFGNDKAFNQKFLELLDNGKNGKGKILKQFDNQNSSFENKLNKKLATNQGAINKNKNISLGIKNKKENIDSTIGNIILKNNPGDSGRLKIAQLKNDQTKLNKEANQFNAEKTKEKNKRNDAFLNELKSGEKQLETINFDKGLVQAKTKAKTDKLKAEADKLKAEVDRIKSFNEKLLKKNSDVPKGTTISADKIEETQQKIRENKERIKAKEEKIKAKEEEINILENRDDPKLQADLLKKEVSALQKEVDDKTKEIIDTQKTLDDLQKEANKTGNPNGVSPARKNFEKLRAEASEKSKTLASKKSQLAQLESKIKIQKKKNDPIKIGSISSELSDSSSNRKVKKLQVTKNPENRGQRDSIIKNSEEKSSVVNELPVNNTFYITINNTGAPIDEEGAKDIARNQAYRASTSDLPVGIN